ncbi:MAG TPA: phosphodiester glycosidase family protein, partial [Bacillales bacterium]
KEKRWETKLAPGLTYTQIKRGHPDKHDYYTVNIMFTEIKGDAKRIAERLKTDGYKPKVKRVKDIKQNDIKQKSLGYLVRVGKYEEKMDAEQKAHQLEKDGFGDSSVVYTGYFNMKTTGPWNIHVIEINPDMFKGSIDSRLATGIVRGKEKVSSIADRSGALAAVNGGYFVVGPDDGTVGDLAGISMVNGNLVSESVGNRTSLILNPDKEKTARITKIDTKTTIVSSDGAKKTIDGLNRKPGLIRSCGGTGGDLPSEHPMHDFTCTDSSELIIFKSVYGSQTPNGEGVEIVLNENGKVVELYKERGTDIPEKGAVLTGTGTAANWLLHHAQEGEKINVHTKLVTNDGTIEAGENTSIINGGPQLLKNGQIMINAAEEGFNWNSDFYYHFGRHRYPRTLAGIKPNGNILLVAAGGGNPEKSIGLSFLESARVMKALGATEALNLDGGGSTTMVVDDQLVNDPTDQTGERPVGDAIVLLPEN